MDWLSAIANESSILLYLLGIMVCTGLIKEYNLFQAFYHRVLRFPYLSKKLAITIISAFSGILPIPGRNVASAGLMDSLAPKDKWKREKYGILNYVATHHWYLWSPIEKSVIIIIAGLGITYLQFLAHSWVLLLIALVVLAEYLIFGMNNDDIEVSDIAEENPRSPWVTVFPVVLALGIAIAGVAPWIVFPLLAVYYIILTKTFDAKKWIGYINWKLMIYVSLVLIVGMVLKSYDKQILSLLEKISPSHFLWISVSAFALSFLLGSSAKFAGIVVLLTSIYGMPYLTYFLALEYAGYLISPTHKCVVISKEYFGTPIKKFLAVLVFWVILTIGWGVISLFL